MTCTSGSPPPPSAQCVTITADEFGAITDVAGTWTSTGGVSESISVGFTLTETGELCPAAGASAPFYHSPSLEELQSMDVTEAPPPQLVDITPVVLSADALEVAAEAVADALRAPAPAPNASPPPPPTQIKSTIAFPVAVQDVAAITSADSPERAAFETSFKDGMAASLGGGDAVSRDDIIIDAITSGSVNVEFHIEVPSTVAQVSHLAVRFENDDCTSR